SGEEGGYPRSAVAILPLRRKPGPFDRRAIYVQATRGSSLKDIFAAIWAVPKIRSMGTLMDQTPNEVTHLINRLRAGDRQALGELFHGYRERLRRMVELRMDARLRSRLDASDVLQEAYLDLAGDLEAYRADPKLSPLLWMRLHVGRRLTLLHPRHLGTLLRDAGLEISLYREALPEASSAALASMLMGRHT